MSPSRSRRSGKKHRSIPSRKRIANRCAAGDMASSSVGRRRKCAARRAATPWMGWRSSARRAVAPGVPCTSGWGSTASTTARFCSSGSRRTSFSTRGHRRRRGVWPVRGLVKVKRPVEGKQVKLLCAQAKGEASWAYHAFIGEFDEAVVPLQGLAATRGWQDGALAVMTADGEPSIQEVGKGAFDPNFKFILDRPHAMTHLGDVPSHAPELLPLPKEEWLRYGTARLHQGEALKLVDETREIANQLPEGEDQTKVENAAIYFEKRAPATHYDAFKARDWPIASGNVEGGHRAFIHPITKRGAGWLVDNLNGVVALACVRQNEWWDEFWTFVKDRRRQRFGQTLDKAA